MTASVKVLPAAGETWDALAALFREGGDPHWCWCYYRIPSGALGFVTIGGR